MSAPGTTAPVESLIVPVMVPVVLCAKAGAARTSETSKAIVSLPNLPIFLPRVVLDTGRIDTNTGQEDSPCGNSDSTRILNPHDPPPPHTPVLWTLDR